MLRLVVDNRPSDPTAKFAKLYSDWLHLSIQTWTAWLQLPFGMWVRAKV